MSRTSTDGFKAFNLLKGTGIEIGALSNPFDLDANVLYADTVTPDVMAEQLKKNEGKVYLERKLVDVSILLEAPFYNFKDIESNSLDFCVSSNVIEHHPNPIYFLLEQFRVTKPSGHVYVKIPNKEITYDRSRISTPISYLENKFINFDFSDEYMRALDIVKNSVGHLDYHGQGEEMARSITNHRDGHHHFFVFDPESTLEMINTLKKYQTFRLVFLNLEAGNIHFSLQKK
jgi:SAM-dependent methyltransferase